MADAPTTMQMLAAAAAAQSQVPNADPSQQDLSGLQLARNYPSKYQSPDNNILAWQGQSGTSPQHGSKHSQVTQYAGKQVPPATTSTERDATGTAEQPEQNLNAPVHPTAMPAQQHTWANEGPVPDRGMDIIRGIGANQIAQHYGLNQEAGGQVSAGGQQAPGINSGKSPWSGYINSMGLDPKVAQGLDQTLSQPGTTNETAINLLDHARNDQQAQAKEDRAARTDMYKNQVTQFDNMNKQMGDPNFVRAMDRWAAAQKQAFMDRLSNLGNNISSYEQGMQPKQPQTIGSGAVGGQGKGSIKADPAAMQMFFQQANNDPAKAWQLAQAAGYTE